MTTSSREESIVIFNDYLEELGHEPMEPKELVDYDFRAGQTNQELKEMARDLVSEAETIKAENKNAWRYEI
jgi:hypothetical protein